VRDRGRRDKRSSTGTKKGKGRGPPKKGGDDYRMPENGVDLIVKNFKTRHRTGQISWRCALGGTSKYVAYLPRKSSLDSLHNFLSRTEGKKGKLKKKKVRGTHLPMAGRLGRFQETAHESTGGRRRIKRLIRK